MILDAYTIVFVWEGRHSDEKEKKMGLETALEYVTEASEDGRPSDVKVYLIQENSEPFIFTTHFHAWDITKPHSIDEKPNVIQEFDTPMQTAELVLADYSRKYTFEEIKAGKYPKLIDVAHLENYLTDEEFKQVFEMTLDEFNKLPSWKSEELKKQKGLY